MIRATVRSHITVSGLSFEQEVRLQRALSVENVEKERAIREHIWGAEEMPDMLSLWARSGDDWIIPRGFAAQLPETLATEIEWVDQRVSVPINTFGWNPISVRDYQEAAVADLLSYEQGVYQSPAGSGKTVAALELARRAQQRTIVIVNNTHIARQWQERAEQHLGISTGILGDNDWDEQDLTVALQQTLWARRDRLSGFWETWGLVILDECHHAPADTFYFTVQQFPALRRVGLSATPWKQKALATLVTASLGPIVTSTDRGMLVERGVIVNPSVRILNSGFNHPFWPTHHLEPDEETGALVCPKADKGCDRKGFTHRNNYTDVVKALVDDEGRNELLGLEILRAYKQGRAVLVVSRRLKHLDNLARAAIKYGVDEEDVYRLSGKEKTSEKLAIYERAEDGQVVIFSTVGDEAMDIPRLDTIVLAFPGRNEGLIEQQIGRVARTHHEKLDPEVVDIRDNMNVLEDQLKARMRVYRRQGLTMAAV